MLTHIPKFSMKKFSTSTTSPNTIGAQEYLFYPRHLMVENVTVSKPAFLFKISLINMVDSLYSGKVSA